MYGIFTNICPKNHPNVGKYTIHGASGQNVQIRSDLHLLRFYAAHLAGDDALKAEPDLFDMLDKVGHDDWGLQSLRRSYGSRP